MQTCHATLHSTALVTDNHKACTLLQVKAWLQGIASSVVTVHGHCNAAPTSLPMCHVEAPSELTAGKQRTPAELHRPHA